MASNRCCRCRQMLPLTAYSKSEQARIARGHTASCTGCKTDVVTIPAKLRREGGEPLMACYRAVLSRDAEDEHGLDTIPPDARAERESRIVTYAREIERMGLAGDGRRFA